MRAFVFPMSISSNGSIATTANYEEILRGQVIDALMTNQGERVFRGSYGCDIQAALFNPADQLVRADAGNYVLNRLQSMVPRVIVSSVVFSNPDPASGIVYVTVTYRPSVIQDEQSITVAMNNQNALQGGNA